MARPVSRRGEGRERVLAAALDLFTAHGVSGTSLHMIADAIGVTKASVYFQFRTKEDIVVAVLAPALAQMATVVEAAEALPGTADRRDATVAGLVDLVVDHRRLVGVLRADAAVGHLLETHDRWPELIDRLSALLLGPAPTPADRVAVSMLGAGLMMSGADPLLADLDDGTLRTHLLRCARALLPGARGAGVGADAEARMGG
jgi:AcrR family transcriptional regulator